MLYSKLGSIPKPETDGTEGWIEVSEPPVAGDGQEVVWWFPPGWVVRPIMPVKEGFEYNWSQSEEKWVESSIEPVIVPVPEPVVTSTDTISTNSGSDTISGVV